MSTTPYQPTLPPEGDFTDAEIDFMENEPPTLFPENQDSNFGFIIRKLFTDRIQELIDQQDTIYNERFVDTSTQFLDEWERQESLPEFPSGLDVVTRQNIVLNRVRKGPFTRTMRRNIVEGYLGSTFGTPADFSPTGLVLDAGGIPMFSSASSVGQLYEIVEDIPNFLYEVNIDNSVSPASGMARELSRVTPAGISYAINLMANAAPRLFWKMDDPAGSLTVKDYSAFSNPGTPHSGVTLGVTSTRGSSLHTVHVANFDNTANAYVSSSYSPFVSGSKRTFLGWAVRNSTTDTDVLFGSAAGGVAFEIQSGGEVVLFQNVSGSTNTWSVWPNTGVWVHWALTYDDSTKVAELFINGATQGTHTMSLGYSGATTFQAGAFSNGASPFGGKMGSVAVYERIVTPAEILAYYHEGSPF